MYGAGYKDTFGNAFTFWPICPWKGGRDQEQEPGESFCLSHQPYIWWLVPVGSCECPQLWEALTSVQGSGSGVCSDGGCVLAFQRGAALGLNAWG